MEKLNCKHLEKIYGQRKVVHDVSLEIKRGEIIGLLGPNGAGKTTFFYMMVGLLKPNKGDIFLSSQKITPLALHERARKGIAYLPQEASLFRSLSVYDNIAMAVEILKLSPKEKKEKVLALVESFGLEKVVDSQAAALSGGERRRCEIARCLAIDPSFILLDEPFAGVDPIAVAEIQKYIYKLKEQNIGVLITDHNVRETLSTCDKAYLMKEGQIFYSGTPEEISQNSDAKKFYLGKSFQLN